ncbi:LysR substrate-binding domain-containing protein [Affinibrenneria salicis]|nr:LysR substrate-binding domain-containing protein [Affinibrenneria salicis]
MTFQMLNYLVALEKYRHFNRAAKACRVGQPTLSEQIRKLEAELGGPLLERTSRKVVFTQEGVRLVRQAQKILYELRRLHDLVERQRDPLSGLLHLGIVRSCAPYLLPHVIPPLRRRFPDLHLRFYEGNRHSLLPQLESGKLDALVLACQPEDAPVAIPLFDEPLLLALNYRHPWAGRHTVTPDMLSELDDLTLAEDDELPPAFSAVRQKAQIHGRLSANLELLRSQLASCTGAGLFPRLAATPMTGVCYIPFQPALTRTLFMIWRGDMRDLRYRCVASTIHATMRRLLV